MALVLGTNCGFVASAPEADPATGLVITCDTAAQAIKHTTPAGVTTITEIGWWCYDATQESNFEVGLYSHDAGNDKPDERLYVDNTNAKGTAGACWKTVAVNWAVSPSTIYWIAFQLDDTATTTRTYYTGGGRISWLVSPTLANPWGASTQQTYLYAIYALYEGTTYSELAGTVASISGMSGNIDITSMSALAGTIAAASVVSGNLGSVIVTMTESIFYKRLIVVSNDQFWYEDI